MFPITLSKLYNLSSWTNKPTYLLTKFAFNLSNVHLICLLFFPELKRQNELGTSFLCAGVVPLDSSRDGSHRNQNVAKVIQFQLKFH